MTAEPVPTSEQPLGFVHARTAEQADQAADALIQAYSVGAPAQVVDQPVLLETISA